MLLGTIGAIGDGMSTNCLLVFASRIVNSLGYGQTRQHNDNFMVEVQKCSLDFVYLGLAVMVVAFMGLVFATYFSWRLALVAFPTLLLLIIPGMIYGKYLVYLSKISRAEYGKANAIMERALSSIKTIYSFTAEKTIIDRYSSILDRTTKLGIKQGIAKGLAVGSTGTLFRDMGFPCLVWKSFGHVQGREWRKDLCCWDFLHIEWTVLEIWRGSLGIALPDLRYFTEASVAATRIFKRIDRVPEIDSEDTKGLVLDKIQGQITFQHVSFTYPCRPDATVLKDFSLEVEAGKTVALVGASGSGKSTAIALLQRFYDVNSGIVKIDGVDLRTLNLKWIRGKMGLVSQDHALFGTSIKENIMFGKLDATMDQIMAAAMAANAHNFIGQLPEGYETKVGERGALLSGGQKQRIAIARAIIKNPVILLLDEATSALDSESETLVQNALDQASMGRTTLVVAHKLSTVRNADLIAVVDNGGIIEIGSHNDLINRQNGHYAKLAKLQRQFSCDEQEQNPETRISSVTSSAGWQSTGKSSPAVFASPLPVNDSQKPVQIPPPSFFRLLSLNAPEWKQALMGSISAITFGAVQPVYALTVGGMIAAFFAPNHDEVRDRIRMYSLIFCSLSVLSIFINLVQHYNFAYMGERLTKRIRLRMLEKILGFETAWFDEEENSSGALCLRLSSEASMVKTLVADRVSLLVQTTSAVTIAMIMGLVVAWKLAIVMIAVQPLTILCFYSKKILLSTISTNFVKAQNQSTQIAVEAVYNHRIVTSFSSVGKVLQIFDEAQEEPRKEARKKSWLAGIGMGSAQCLTFMSWALDFWFGGTLVEKGEISAGDVFKTFFILVSTGKVIAEAGSMTSDLSKGSTAVASVFKILDRQSLIPGSYQGAGDGSSGTRLEKLSGKIEMKKIDFAYPSRPETLILRQFCLEIHTIDLHGPSATADRSALLSLLESDSSEAGFHKFGVGLLQKG
ncbi:ABC TRANSPORTER B FAMILY MEMBER 8-RELATED [Salix viminalis]|uniref:ABC TRANSPORTER B FAMILY MEMBER 8-RELATED n=1 Tax=Salix viminalis TaxID=40686 RepID=A0A9Q0NPK5_SALVM|nr:ABC TRANSPORTER B FAMILY MEMBER 8-RELATED [Salix viminalis]